MRWAAQSGHTGILTLLIAYGADKTALLEEQQNTYAEAITKGEALRLSNTKEYKSTILDTGRELAQLKKQKNIPDSVLLDILHLAVEPSVPHDLSEENRSKLALYSISRSRSGNIEVAAEPEERAANSHTERVAAERGLSTILSKYN